MVGGTTDSKKTRKGSALERENGCPRFGMPVHYCHKNDPPAVEVPPPPFFSSFWANKARVIIRN